MILEGRETARAVGLLRGLQHRREGVAGARGAVHNTSTWCAGRTGIVADGVGGELVGELRQRSPLQRRRLARSGGGLPARRRPSFADGWLWSRMAMRFWGRMVEHFWERDVLGAETFLTSP